MAGLGAWVTLTAVGTASAATITVDTTAQATSATAPDDQCSLAEAIIAANTDAVVDGCDAGAGADVIQLPGGTYELTAPYDAARPHDALPQVTTDISIAGAGADTTVLRVGDVAVGFDAWLHIFWVNQGALELKSVTLTKTTTSDAQGVHVDRGVAALKDCIFSGLGHYTPGLGGIVGAAEANQSDATLNIENTTFSNNGARSVHLEHGSATLDHVTFLNNTNVDLYTQYGDVTVTVKNTVFDSNLSGPDSSGAAVQFDNVGAARISDGVFKNNHGSAIYLNYGGPLAVERSTIHHNLSKEAGAGIRVGFGTLTVIQSTLFANQSMKPGGALYNYDGSVTLKNTTLSGNSSAEYGGGIAWDVTGSLLLNNVTVTDNSATLEGGGIAVIMGAAAPLKVSNSIVAGNRSELGSDDCFTGEGRELTSDGHNLIGVSQDCAISAGEADQVGTSALPLDPQLAPLGLYGGTLEVNPPLDSSPAVDHGAPADAQVTCEALDQNGTSRPVGQSCDVGAFEGSVPAPTGDGGSGGAGGEADKGGEAGETAGGLGGATSVAGADASGEPADVGGQSVAGAGGVADEDGYARKKASGGCNCRLATPGSEGGTLLAAFGFSLALALRRGGVRRRRKSAEARALQLN